MIPRFGKKRAGFWILATLIILVSTGGVGLSAGGTASDTKVQSRPARVEGEILVRFKPDVTPDQARGILTRLGMRSMRGYRHVSNLHHVRLKPGTTVEDAIAQLKADPSVLYAEPNYLIGSDSACSSPCTPNDPLYSDPGSWWHADIGTPQAWTVTTGDGSVVVAEMDSGIDYNHPDLVNNIWTNPTEIPGNGLDDDGDGYVDDIHGYNATTDTCVSPCTLHPGGDPMDDETGVKGHGTRLAGIVGAVGNNGIGVVGVNWNVKLMPVKVRYEPNRQTSLALSLLGVDYILAKRSQGVNIRVVDMSFGSSTWSQSLQDAIDALRDAGMLLLGTAGNSSTNLDSVSTDFHTHLYDNVLFVAATDQNDAVATFSNYGQVDIHLASPGVGILSTVRSVYSPMYQTDSGTSYSAPMVEGTAALLAAAYPQITISQLKARIVSSTIQDNALMSKVASGGRLNVAGVFNAPITDLLPMGYQLARIRVGDKYYLDRTFTVSALPTGLNGLWWVRTKNDDNAQTTDDFMHIGLGQTSTVYVGYDPRAQALPNWLRPAQGWSDTGLSMLVSGDSVGSLRIYEKTFGPGLVILGGNHAAGYVAPSTGDTSNYVVLINVSGGTGPTVPTGLQATPVSSSQINLSWNASTSPFGIAAYRVYRVGLLIASVTTTSYADTGLAPLTPYSYTVTAVGGDSQESAPAGPVSATTFQIDTQSPSPPGNLQAVPVSSSEIDLSWTSAIDNVGIGGYKVYRNGILISSVTGTNYADTGLAPSTTYQYTVVAYDTSGLDSLPAGPVAAGTLNSTPSVIKGVQSGLVTLSAGSTSATVTINAVDPTKAFLVFGTSFNDANPKYSQVTGQITNSTTLTFQRVTGSSAPAITVKWYVSEFLSGVSVQRGSAAMLTTLPVSSKLNVTLPQPVDTTKSFPLISFRIAGAAYDANDFIKAKITSPTNLELMMTDSYGSGGTVEWQVIEFEDARVQTGDLSFAAGDSAVSASINSADPGKSWLVYTYRTDSGTDGIGDKLVRGLMTGATTLTFDRNYAGPVMNVTWYLVEFTNGTTVQQASASFGTADTVKNIGIQSVDLTKSLAAGGYMAKGGRSSYAADDNPGVGWMTLDLTSGTNLRISRGVTGSSTADIGWFVINFP